MIAIRFLVVLFVMSAFLGGAMADPKRDDAANFPSRHAWNLFLLVNHPAMDPTKCHCRGVADPTKPIGAPGTTAVWETWRLSSTEVFLNPAIKPPDWNDTSLPGGPVNGKVPEEPKSMLLARLAGAARLPKPKMQILFDPNDGIFLGHGQFGESRMNEATYNFVRDNDLYSTEGQVRNAVSYVSGKMPAALSFPVDSMEVKAAWIELTAADIAAGRDRQYYVAEYKGKKYGLATMHIITKDIPNWFWSTFHHVNNPAGGAETPDAYGRPHELDNTVWRYYVLGGTQTDFVDSIGRPTLLSDSLVEKGIERSSCISCHARATVAPVGTSRVGNKPVVGVPDPSEFETNGKPSLLQTDFLFSLTLRAHSEKGD